MPVMKIMASQIGFLFLFFILPFSSSNSHDKNIYTNTFAIEVKPEYDSEEIVNELANSYGFTNLGKIGTLHGHYLLHHKKIQKRSTEYSYQLHSQLKFDPRILFVEQQKILKRKKRHATVWDAENLVDPLFVEQWYLNKGAWNGYDMNVVGAWNKGFTGKGVVVTILDDGIQFKHPDLERNYDPDASYDLNSNDADPTPQDNGDNKHGTRCAGEVAAEAGNEFCGVGIAFNASIGGVRMLDGPITDVIEAKALSLNPNHIQVYSASWGPEDDGKTVDGPGRLAKRAFTEGIKKGRNGKGSIFVWASGNGGKKDDNCNCDGYTNSIYTLSISSATQSGKKPWYLESCSSTLASTYSSGTSGKDRNIITVDMDNSYLRSIQDGEVGDASKLCTKSHTGTSASAPIAAAICALALEANPKLSWRDMQHIVVMTSRSAPLKEEPGWLTNGVGRDYSHQFGYGLMDAEAMVDLALKWIPVPTQRICETPVKMDDDMIIPIENENQLEVILNTTACAGTSNSIKYLEHVQARLTLKFKPRGSIKISLVSPLETLSHLLLPRVRDNYHDSFSHWPFLSVHFWGENPVGIWKLIVKNDGASSFTPGRLISFGMTFYGLEEAPKTRNTGYSSIRFSSRQTKEKNKINNCGKENKFKSPNSKNCVANCSEGYFGDYASRLCIPCYNDCLTCFGPLIDNCLSCKYGFYYYDNMCIKKCPNGYFSDELLKECLPCMPHCKSCLKSQECKLCESNFKLTSNGDRCVSICNGICNCSELCETCDLLNPNICLSCKKGMRLVGTNCTENECPNGTYESIKSNECRKCHESCKSCLGPSHKQCTSCHEKTFLKDNVCYSCPPEKYLDKEKKECLSCHQSCKECSGETSNDCIKCEKPLFLLNARCLPCCSNINNINNSTSSNINNSSELRQNDCCQCDNSSGPCFSLYKQQKSDLYEFPSEVLEKLLDSNSPLSVILIICKASFVLFLIIFLVSQIMFGSWLKKRDYKNYRKILPEINVNNQLENSSLINDEDDEEDSLFEKA